MSCKKRNVLCHCGSGKKYKKCHWEIDNRPDQPSSKQINVMLKDARRKMKEAIKSAGIMKTPSELKAILYDMMKDQLGLEDDDGGSGESKAVGVS